MLIRSLIQRLLPTRCIAGVCVFLLTICSFAGPVAADSILLEFSSSNCPPCRAMQPIVSELIARGVPVRQVDVQAEPQLVQRYQIRSTPTYVVVQDGREVTRLVGAQTAAQLYTALKQNPGGELVPTRSELAGPTPTIQDPQTRLAPMTSPSRSLAQSSDRSIRSELGPSSQPGSSNAASGDQWQSLASLPSTDAAPPARTASVRSEAMPNATLANAVERAQAATVRLRVHDGRGYGAGTGTIIDVHGEEALVLTCGHLFRDGDGKGKIEVDLFVAGQPRTVIGQLIDYDAGDRDIGLVAIRPDMPVQPVEVVQASDVLKVGQPAFSFGCDRGDPPSRRDTRITGVNKYNQNIGGSNLEISGAPIDGRSGGGLFDERGRLVGVCNAADYKSDIGIYTGPGAIHWQLDRVQLERLYQDAPAESLASNETEPLSPAAATSSSGSLPTNMNQFAGVEATGSAAAAPQGTSDLAAATADTEMIVIIRDRNGNSHEQVLTLHEPDAHLVQQIRQAAHR
ncbi:trypsin-like peptidase domain-containing protein [Allorhodopirellula solitaria]|uniref:Thioredoxin n=1 Tax=Allorhodopirellula solitaria TaxID=2527987 RepID=A0A5C5Y0A4_9BACT|nr:trypsin-like peptidase domain-containing protein [Allorhodopirellula solitaria]TWT67072.1 Thioredoxin [Allorhodopirellula solitaria]